MKIAVIGAGSTYTPELIEGLIRPAELQVDEVVMHDIDAERLKVVGGLASRMADAAGWHGRLNATTDRSVAIDQHRRLVGHHLLKDRGDRLALGEPLPPDAAEQLGRVGLVERDRARDPAVGEC